MSWPPQSAPVSAPVATGALTTIAIDRIIAWSWHLWAVPRGVEEMPGDVALAWAGICGLAVGAIHRWRQKPS